MKNNKEEDTLYLLKRLLKEYIKPYFLMLMIAIILMAIVAASSAIHAWMIKPALDDIFLNKSQKMLSLIPIIVIFIAIIKGVSTYFQNYIMKYVGQRIITNMQSRLYSHLIYADIDFLHKQSSGKLISRFTNDITMMRNALTNFLSGIAKDFLTIIFLIGLMFALDMTLALITFIVFPIAILPIIRLGRKMRKISASTQEELGNYTSQLDDSFQTIKAVKSYRREKYEINKADIILESIFNLYKKAIRTECLSSPMMEMLSGIAIAAVIWYGGYQVIEGNTSPGTFFAFITAFIAAYKPVKNLADLNTNLQEGLAAIKRLFKVLDTRPKIIDNKNAKKIDLKKGGIEFKNVFFSYNSQTPSLKDINIKIAPGKTTAFVGSSGSGKSTIASLLLRFYNANKGQIKIDGIDIQDITIDSLRKSISLVSQDTLLFDDTIEANILYGNPKAKRKEVEDAAKYAYAHDFINKLPEKYKSMVGQNGLKLSGGQKQRIAIARAFLKNSPILLFDEATSALDSISEKYIQDSIKKIRKNKTNIIIAHRLSTIIDADIIYVIDNGSVVESGKHHELLKKGKIYKKLYNMSLEQK